MPDFDPNHYLIDLKGKKYLPVAARLAWLREVQPDAVILTTLVERTDTFALFRAEVALPETGARATGHGSETKADFTDFLEKAETKAVGRALAMLGYGTMHALELDEGHRIVDSPITKRPAPAAAYSEGPASEAQRAWFFKQMAAHSIAEGKAADILSDVSDGPVDQATPAQLRSVIEATRDKTLTYGEHGAAGRIGWHIIRSAAELPVAP
jgi:hypothetical protein